LPGTVPLTVIGHGVCVQFQITYGLQQHRREYFSKRGCARNTVRPPNAPDVSNPRFRAR
jgi:hypothetical protein